MLRYCVYFLNEFGLTQSFDVFEAVDDQAAIALCEPHKGDHSLELWCEGRKVITIDREEPQPRPGWNRGRPRRR